jgi:hypothetical protein
MPEVGILISKLVGISAILTEVLSLLSSASQNEFREIFTQKATTT